MAEYGKKRRAVVDEVPSFRAFVVERDDRFDGVPGHPGVFVGLGPVTMKGRRVWAVLNAARELEEGHG